MESGQNNQQSNKLEKQSDMKSKREKYIDKLSKQLKKWEQELTELEEKSGKKVEEMKGTLAKNMENFRARRDQLKEKVQRLEQAGEEAFKEIRTDTEKLWNDAQNALQGIRKELKK